MLSALACVGLVALVFTGAYRGLFVGGGRTVRAVFTGTQQLHTGDDVRIDGVAVGKVDSIALNRGARSATVSMTLSDSAGPVYADATASLRWKTLLGAAFYLDLGRGTPAAGRLGTRPIPIGRTSGQVQLEDITSVFSPRARAGLQTLPREMARALGDANAPAQVLRTLDGIAPSVTQGMNALRGQQTDVDLRSLVAATGAAMTALGASDVQLQDLVAGAAATLQTTAGRQSDIQSAISQAPSVEAATQLTMSGLDSTLRLTDPLIARLQGSASEIARTVGPLRPTLVEADGLLSRAMPLMSALRPAMNSLAQTSNVGLPLLEGLSPSLARLADRILPYLNEKDPATQHSTAQMIGPTLAGLGGAVSQEDNQGHFIRFPATAGSADLYFPCQTYINDPDKKMWIECETLQTALRSLLSYKPLGPPSAGLRSDSRTRKRIR
jgi:phospholipid/cholesterol/gamma-HCH transport system substrate-binding protein